MKRRTLILRDRATKVSVAAEHIEIKSLTNSYVVGFAQIEAIYLNKAISLNIGACFAIASHVPLFLIDKEGYIVGRVEVHKDAEV